MQWRKVTIKVMMTRQTTLSIAKRTYIFGNSILQTLFRASLSCNTEQNRLCHYRDGTQFINTPYSLFQICTYRLRYLSAKAYRILRDSIKFKDKKVVIFYFQYAPYVPIILPVIFMIKQQRVVLILQYRNGTHFNQSFPLSNNLASIVRDSHYHNPNFPFILHIHFKIDFLYFICFSQKNVSFKI